MRFAGSTRRPGRVMLKAALLTVALALGATAAHAADACYAGVGGSVLVFKKFKLPRAGECSPINGFQQASNCILTGTACGTSDGILVHFNFNQICRFDPFGGAYSFNTDRSIQQGDALFCHQSISTGQFSCPTFIASKVTCPAPESFAD
jgi:hypothetical protein